ncbi:hypothetical protein TorRG33x02_305670, partial [Trema orientale]
MDITRSSSVTSPPDIKSKRPKKMKEKFESSTTLSKSKSKMPKKMKEKSGAGDKETKRSQKRKVIDDGKGSREKEKSVVKKLRLEPNLVKTSLPKHMRELFGVTIKYLRVGLKVKSVRSKDNNYKLLGFSLAFQIWLYETIPTLSGLICNHVDSAMPRIVNWSTRITPLYKFLERKVFHCKELEIKKMFPTNEERKLLNLKEFQYNSIDSVPKNLVEEDNDFEVPSPKIPFMIEASTYSKSTKPSSSKAKRVHEIGFGTTSLDFEKHLKNIYLEQLQLGKKFGLLREDLASRHDTLRRDISERYSVIIGVLAGIQEKIGCGDIPIRSVQNINDSDQIFGNQVESIVEKSTERNNVGVQAEIEVSKGSEDYNSKNDEKDEKDDQ